RSDIRRTKKEIDEYQRAQESHVQRTRALWVLVIALIASVAGFSWYASPFLSEHQELFGKMPMLQSALDKVSNRVASTEQQVGAESKDRSALSEQMSQLGQKAS